MNARQRRRNTVIQDSYHRRFLLYCTNWKASLVAFRMFGKNMKVWCISLCFWPDTCFSQTNGYSDVCATMLDKCFYKIVVPRHSASADVFWYLQAPPHMIRRVSDKCVCNFSEQKKKTSLPTATPSWGPFVNVIVVIATYAVVARTTSVSPKGVQENLALHAENKWCCGFDVKTQATEDSGRVEASRIPQPLSLVAWLMVPDIKLLPQIDPNKGFRSFFLCPEHLYRKEKRQDKNTIVRFSANQ